MFGDFILEGFLYFDNFIISGLLFFCDFSVVPSLYPQSSIVCRSKIFSPKYKTCEGKWEIHIKLHVL